MYEKLTPEEIKDSILGHPALAGFDVREGSFLHDMIAPCAMEVWKAYQAIDLAENRMFADVSSGIYIDKTAEEYGIVRKEGTRASVELAFAGTPDTRIPAGSIFTTLTGLAFATDAECTLTNGSGTVSATADGVGEQYNVPAGIITEQYQNTAGVATVTNPLPAHGGTDFETDAALFHRLDTFRKKPSASGNVYDYENWALSVDGVGHVTVTPEENGINTVGVMIASQEKRPVATDVIDACATYIETVRTVGARVSVYTVTELEIDISAVVELVDGTAIDEVVRQYSELAEAYLKEISMVQSEVKINALGALLLDVPGVIDYSAIRLNGINANIAIPAKSVAVLGGVQLAD